MLSIHHLLAIILLNILSVNSARILFISCTPSPSHQKPFQQVWKALALKGHEMHVVTPNPLEYNTLPNLIQYNISDVYTWAAAMNKAKPDEVKSSLQKPGFFYTLSKELSIPRAWHALNEYTLNLKDVQKLILAKPKLPFDAVIVESLYPTLNGFAGYFKAPLIGICSLGAPTNTLDAIGNVLNPVVSPDQNIPLKRDLSFRDRLLSVLYAIWIRLVYHWYILPWEDVVVKRYFGEELPYLGEIERNMSVLLLNRNQISHRMMQVVPGVVEFGGFHYDKTMQSLRPDIQRFLDKSKKGVIYFSLGAAIKQVLFLTGEQIDIFKNVLRGVPYNVLWKWENETMKGKPDNVFISQWINQTAVLEHPNVKLFITQGGLQSTEEAIAAHKPIIGIPFHSDQTTNVDTCVKYGMGKMLDLEDLTEDNLRNYILEIINNPSYAQNAKHLDELMKDQPQDGLEKAIWWIEYVIRHKGARHLRSVAVDMPWWQYLMLDVLSFIVGILLAVASTIYIISKLIIKGLKIMFGRNKSKGSPKKKKKE